MVIVETPVFTRRLTRLMNDEVYRELQEELVRHPDGGDLIPGSGGLRKLRWKGRGRGKRGGLRIIYYWNVPDRIFMLLPYSKNETADLTKDQIKVLRQLVEEWLK